MFNNVSYFISTSHIYTNIFLSSLMFHLQLGNPQDIEGWEISFVKKFSCGINKNKVSVCTTTTNTICSNRKTMYE